MTLTRLVSSNVLVFALVAACGSSNEGSGSPSGAGGNTNGAGGGIIGGGGFVIHADSGPGPQGGNREGGSVVGPVPADFIKAEAGGYKLGPPVTGQGTTDTGINNQSGCGVIVGVVRDFRGNNEMAGHPDFESFSGSGATRNMVAAELGPDLKPVYTSVCEANAPRATCPNGQQTTGRANFDQWFRFTDGVNKPYLVYFMFQAQPNSNVITFNSQFFFPLDGAGWNGSANGNDNKMHNFGFTTELHTKFEYRGGETFRFEGDDDLWVFINNRLAIDLGGLHSSLNASIDLDSSATMLGITKGQVYPLELFHAERHTNASRFRLDTSLTLVDCGSIPPDIK